MDALSSAPARAATPRTGLPGLVALAVVPVAALALAVPLGQSRYWVTIYDKSRWALLVAVACAAVVMLLPRRSRPVVTVAAVVGWVTAVQLAATGLFAFRRWVSTAGAAGFGPGDTATVRSLALALACAGGVAALSFGLAWLRASEPPRLKGHDVPAAVISGSGLMAGLPWLLGAGMPKPSTGPRCWASPCCTRFHGVLR